MKGKKTLIESEFDEEKIIVAQKWKDVEFKIFVAKSQMNKQGRN